jgi:hypothetical protein
MMTTPGLELSRETLEHPLGRSSIAGRHTSESRLDRLFHSSAPIAIYLGAKSRKSENSAPVVAWIVRTSEQPLGNQPAQYSGESTGMDMEQSGEIAGRQTREQPGHPQY